MRLSRLVLVLTLLVTGGVVAWFLSGDTAHADDPQALYVSGFEVGKGNEAILNLHNTSPDAGDLYSVNVAVFETSAGRPISSLSGTTFNLFKGETLRLDIGAIVKAHQASLGDVGNTKFKGPVQVIVSGTGGAFRAFGPQTVSAQALQSQGKARFQPLARWVAR